MPICRHCRKTNHTTPEVINSRAVEAYPVLSLAALRKLAEWYAAYHSTRQGVHPCADLDVGQSPPASSASQSPVNADLRTVSASLTVWRPRMVAMSGVWQDAPPLTCCTPAVAHPDDGGCSRLGPASARPRREPAARRPGRPPDGIPPPSVMFDRTIAPQRLIPSGYLSLLTPLAGRPGAHPTLFKARASFAVITEWQELCGIANGHTLPGSGRGSPGEMPLPVCTPRHRRLLRSLYTGQ